jgi:GT2 family glycosyltransferase
MKVLVVIVNWRTPDLTVDCLRSIAGEVAAMPGTRAIVTDNASGDGSVEKIRAAIDMNGWSNWATVTPLEKNGGYAYGNNAAIRPALVSPERPDYIYLLNPDTIAHPGAIQQLVQFMNEHPKAGIAGGRAENRDGTVRRSVFRFHSVPGEFENGLRLNFVSQLLERYMYAPPVPEVPSRADWVSGASMMIRREVFEQIGLLDEGYFMYFEETDFCFRAKRAGWEVWYVPASRIIHLVGQASGVTGAQRAAKRRPRYWFDSRRRYFLHNHGAIKTILADLAWACGFALFNLIRAIRGKPRTDPPWLWWDFVRYNFGAYRRT